MMGMSMSLQLIQRCVVCNESVDNHASQCPVGLMDKVLDKLPQIKCPRCRGKVSVNKGDFFECRKCHTQFTTGVFFHKPGTEQEYLHNLRGDDYILVVEMEEKGTGEFPIDKLLKDMEVRVKEARKKARKK